MNSEIELKKKIKDSAKAQGGFAVSLASGMHGGLPDLYVVMPGFAPLLLEAKWIKNTSQGFKRKIPYSPMQRNFFNNCNTVVSNAAIGIIGFKLDKITYMCIIDPQRDVICSDFIFYTGYDTIYKGKKLFDVKKALTHYFERRLTAPLEEKWLEHDAQFFDGSGEDAGLAVLGSDTEGSSVEGIE
jgi:hypothetical protein